MNEYKDDNKQTDLHTYVSYEEYQLLRRIAYEDKLSLSAIVKKAIKLFIEEREISKAA